MQVFIQFWTAFDRPKQPRRACRGHDGPTLQPSTPDTHGTPSLSPKLALSGDLQVVEMLYGNRLSFNHQ